MKIDLSKIKVEQTVIAESKKKISLVAEDLIDIVQIVKSYRKKNNLSQDDLAKYSNISRLTINEFENGKSDIKLSTLFKILRACSLLLEIKER